MCGETLPDRRRYKRVKADSGSFVSLGTSERKLWHILDISRAGLAFRYVHGMESVNSQSELEIVTRDTSFSLDHVPYRTVSDWEMEKPGSPFRLRRCGVEFMALTKGQTDQLEYFISNRSCGLG